MLEQEQWAEREHLADLLMENQWGQEDEELINEKGEWQDI